MLEPRDNSKIDPWTVPTGPPGQLGWAFPSLVRMTQLQASVGAGVVGLAVGSLVGFFTWVIIAEIYEASTSGIVWGALLGLGAAWGFWRLIFDDLRRTWERAYIGIMQGLRYTDLPLLIVDDACWRAFLECWPSELLRMVAPAGPRTRLEHLQYAIAFWEPLQRYRRGDRTFRTDLLRGWQRLTALREQSPISYPPMIDTALRAQFAAIYDFFTAGHER